MAMPTPSLSPSAASSGGCSVNVEVQGSIVEEEYSNSWYQLNIIEGAGWRYLKSSWDWWDDWYGETSSGTQESESNPASGDRLSDGYSKSGSSGSWTWGVSSITVYFEEIGTGRILCLSSSGEVLCSAAGAVLYDAGV